MITFAPTSRCALPWCRAWHLPGDSPDHRAQIATWNLGEVEVEVFVYQVDPNPPVVRLIRLDDQGGRVQDIDAELAAGLADLLDALPGRTRELIAALRVAAEALSP